MDSETKSTFRLKLELYACNTMDMAAYLFGFLSLTLKAPYWVNLPALAAIVAFGLRRNTLRRQLEGKEPLPRRQKHILISCYAALPTLLTLLMLAGCIYIQDARLWVLLAHSTLFFISVLVVTANYTHADSHVF